MFVGTTIAYMQGILCFQWKTIAQKLTLRNLHKKQSQIMYTSFSYFKNLIVSIKCNFAVVNLNKCIIITMPTLFCPISCGTHLACRYIHRLAKHTIQKQYITHHGSLFKASLTECIFVPHLAQAQAPSWQDCQCFKTVSTSHNTQCNVVQKSMSFLHSN